METLIEQYKLLTDHMADCIWLMDLSNYKFKYISPSIYSLRGLTVEEALNECFEDSMPPNALEKIKSMTEERVTKFLAGDRSPDVVMHIDELQQYHKNGDLIDVEISTKYIEDPVSGRIEVVGVTRDITSRKRVEKELYEKNELLKSLAVRDELTQVFNRRYFNEVVISEVERSWRYSEPLSMILFDLDGFKTINDHYGHAVGDEILRDIGHLSTQFIRHPDTLARWGGDEFVVLLPQTRMINALIVAEKLKHAIENYIHPTTGKLTASFGVSELKFGETYESLFESVDHALYRAKEAGKNKVVGDENHLGAHIARVRFEWSQSWNSGNALMDSQHRQILESANLIMEGFLTNSSMAVLEKEIDDLLRHVILHFESEEALMKEIGYPDLESHVMEHRALFQSAQITKEGLMNKKMSSSHFFSFFLDEVVIGHIIKSDVLYYRYIK